MELEEFVRQNKDLAILKERFALTDSEIEDAFIEGLNNLINLKSICRKVNKDK